MTDQGRPSLARAAPAGIGRWLLPVLVVLPAFAILVALGTWQWHRLRWKTDMLAAIAAAEAAPPSPLGDAAPAFAKVLARGRFDHAREARFGLEVRGGVLGTHLLTPLLRDGAAPLLVDRGWVPMARDRPIARPEGEAAVTGWVLPAEPGGWLAAEDDLAGRQFYSFDPARIGAAIGLPGMAPFGLVALGEVPPGALPEPGRALPRPPNNHLGYVITWYGLAAALLAVFAVWMRRRLKEFHA